MMRVKQSSLIFINVMLVFCMVPEWLSISSNCLKFDLIHIDSPGSSPSYVANLTQEERVHRLVSLSEARAHSFVSIKLKNGTADRLQRVQPQTVRPPVRGTRVHSSPATVFMVRIGIGTFNKRPSYKSYYMNMDTGSDLMWIQCEDCKKPGNQCFSQRDPIFANSKSKSYKALPCNRHELCYPGKCIGDFCSYDLYYGDESRSIGILGTETLTLPSSNNNSPNNEELVLKFVFGCGCYNVMTYSSEEVSGILGLGWGARSFVTQIRTQSYNSFSYCLQHFEQVTHDFPSFLRFGSDIVHEVGLSSTTMHNYGDKKLYYLDLRGISVQGTRLDIPEYVFQVNRDLTGGTIIDSGAAYTHLIYVAYNRVNAAITAYMDSIKSFKRARFRSRHLFEVCYTSTRLTRELLDQRPSMTFHFAGADLVIRHDSLFTWLDNKTFCLATRPHAEMSILGAYQQANTRFIYDLERSQLQFKAADCLHNP